jgi:hypothetical protein
MGWRILGSIPGIAIDVRFLQNVNAGFEALFNWY